MVRLTLCSIVVLGAVACISGEVTGGEALPVIADIPDCTQTGAACSTWTYLYACYFSTSSPHTGGCSAQGTSCHGSGGFGASESGFVCGPTSDTCWHGITSASFGFGVSVQLKDGGAATDTNLLIALHSKSTQPVGTTGNNMPLKSLDAVPPESSYLFTSDDLACINGWVKAGAPEN